MYRNMKLTACNNRLTFSKGETNVKTDLNLREIPAVVGRDEGRGKWGQIFSATFLFTVHLSKFLSTQLPSFAFKTSTTASSCKYLPTGNYPIR